MIGAVLNAGILFSFMIRLKRLKNFWQITKKTFKAWIQRSPLREGAVVAYFAVFSIPGLIVLLINFAALLVDKNKIQEELHRQITGSINPSTAKQVEEVVSKAGDLQGGWVSTAVSILIILFGATRVFVHLQITLNNIWEVQRVRSALKTQLRKSLFSIGLILVLSFLLLISMAFSALFSAIRHRLEGMFKEVQLVVFHVIDFAAFLVLVSVLFALMFKYLPEVKLRWKTVLMGALITGVLFVLLKYALSTIIATFDPASVYGAAGSVVLIMLWFAVAAMILFFGAEFCRQFALFHKQSVEPRKGAEFKRDDPAFKKDKNSD